MNYKVIDINEYYRKGVFRHFTEDCKCSVSMTARVDVTDLVKRSKETNTKFYINFLYLLCKVLNSRDDYKMSYLWQTNELICYDRINPTQYIFHEDTETCRTMPSSTRTQLMMLRPQSRRASISLTLRITPTGSMHPTCRGSLTTRSTLSFLTATFTCCR